MSKRFNKTLNTLQINTNISSITMAKQSQGDIDQIIQRAHPTNRDLVRRDILQSLQLVTSNLLLKISPYYYNDGSSKELLCLSGTVGCQYKGNRYNIPIEIWFQVDHPHVAPFGYVKPTSEMYVSTTSQDVQPDGTIVLPYLKKWRHPNSDVASLINAMSEAFSRSPPVYSAVNVVQSRSTPYPTQISSMPMPSGMIGVNPSYSYSSVYPTSMGTIPQDVYRESLETAVLDKIRIRLIELTQIGNAQINSLKKTEQDLLAGEKKIQLFIENAQQQQIEAENYFKNIQMKLNEMSDATEKMSSRSTKDNSIKDDALIPSAPIYKQLLQSYAEEHSIQDLFFYLADGLRRQSIGLDIYLKHIRELSQRQFILRATMHKSRQIAGLTNK